jgi:hypothetical protein
MLGFQAQAKAAINGLPPEKTDYRKADNPWKARYGNNWEKKLMALVLCLPTVRLKPWWYHDALSLLTANEMLAWMK